MKLSFIFRFNFTMDFFSNFPYCTLHQPAFEIKYNRKIIIWNCDNVKNMKIKIIEFIFYSIRVYMNTPMMIPIEIEHKAKIKMTTTV
jgi:intein-encoded DNA endonuclease-like protein